MTKAATTSSASSRPGIAGWFKRLFSGATAPPPRAATPRRPEPSAHSPQPSAATPHNDNAADLDPAWVEMSPDFAAHAHALAMPFAQPAPLTAAQVERRETLVAAVRAEAASADNEPTALPTASLRVLQLVAKEDLELGELATAVQQDPALTAAVLRVANSAALGASSPINTVRDAVTRLGVRDSARVVGVVATQALFNPQSKLAQKLFGARLGDMHVASSTTASGAAQLSMERGVGRSDMAFLGGMLHAVGKSLAISALARLIDSGRTAGEVDDAVLDALLEEVHVELGTQAHERWKLPQYLFELCAQQHAPKVPLNAGTKELHLVRVASGLIALRQRPCPRERVAELTDSLGALGITPLQARAIDTGLRERMLQVRQVLSA